MRDLNIAYGKRVNSKTWTNSTTSWDALCERLCHTAVTGETAAQYHAMTREERKELLAIVKASLKAKSP